MHRKSFFCKSEEYNDKRKFKKQPWITDQVLKLVNRRMICIVTGQLRVRTKETKL